MSSEDGTGRKASRPPWAQRIVRSVAVAGVLLAIVAAFAGWQFWPMHEMMPIFKQIMGPVRFAEYVADPIPPEV